MAYRQLSTEQKRIKKVEPINLLQDVKTKTSNNHKYQGSYSPNLLFDLSISCLVVHEEIPRDVFHQLRWERHVGVCHWRCL